MTLDFDDFLKIDIRAGTIVRAQITEHYEPEGLIGRQVIAVVNFPPRQIGKFMSQVLVLGFADDTGEIRLVSPDAPVSNGVRLN